MVQLSTPVHAVEQEVREGTPLPIGYYKAIAIVEEELDTKPDEKGNPTDGKYIKVEFQIISPAEFDKRKVWNMYNIINKNQQTVTIALEQLGNFAWAAGIGSLSNTTDLLFKEVTLELGIDPAKGNWPAKNKIKAYWPALWTEAQIEGHKKAKKGVASAPSPSLTPTATSSAPWKKK